MSKLAALFGELAYNQIHDMDGTNEQKAVWHALVGGIMGELSGGSFLAGATAAGINKLLTDQLHKAAGGDPALHQWLSAGLGAVIGQVAGSAQTGASTAASGTKHNNYDEEKAAQNNESAQEIIVAAIPIEQLDAELVKKLENAGNDETLLRIIFEENLIHVPADLAPNEFVMYFVNVGAVIGGTIAIIVDGFGNVYQMASVGGQLGAFPIDYGNVRCKIAGMEGNESPSAISSAISGLSLNVSASAGVQGTLSWSLSGTSAGAGVSLPGGSFHIGITGNPIFNRHEVQKK